MEETRIREGGDQIIDATVKESSLTETFLGEQLLDIFKALPKELQHQCVGVTTSTILRRIFFIRHQFALNSIHNIQETDEKAHWLKYHLARLEALFLQDIILFLEKSIVWLRRAAEGRVVRASVV